MRQKHGTISTKSDNDAIGRQLHAFHQYTLRIYNVIQ